MSLDDGEIGLNDIIRIMISTDNHLGYGEKDPIRGKYLNQLSLFKK